MKSKFSFRTYFYFLIMICFIILPFYLFINKNEAFGKDVNIKFFFICVLLLFTNFFLISGIIKRVISLTLNEQNIIVKNILLKETKILFKDLDGFEIAIEKSKAGNYEVLFLVKDNKTILQLSEFHISNYLELKEVIKDKITDLGLISSNIINDWKRYF